MVGSFQGRHGEITGRLGAVRALCPARQMVVRITLCPCLEGREGSREPAKRPLHTPAEGRPSPGPEGLDLEVCDKQPSRLPHRPFCLRGRERREREVVVVVAVVGATGPAAPALQVIQELRSHAHLLTVPVSGKQGRTLMHLAVQSRNLPVLSLVCDAAALTALCRHVDEGLGHSLAFTGLDPGLNDIYVLQPLLSFNGQPLYVGHERGHYLFYYEPRPGHPRLYDSGWCVAPNLGSGAAPFRLTLHASPMSQAPSLLSFALGDALPPARGAGALLERLRLRVSRALGAFLRGRSARATATADLPPPTRVPSELSATKTATKKHSFKPSLGGALHRLSTASNRPLTGSLHDLDALPEFASAEFGPGADPGFDAPRTVPLLSPEAAGLMRVPHSQELLTEAVAAGDLAVVRHLIGTYQRCFPQCLRWQCAAGHGLWQDLPEKAQADVAAALLQGRPRATVQTPDGAAEADLQARTLEGPGDVVDLREYMQSVFCHEETVTAAVADIPIDAWPDVVVMLSPGHIAAATRDRDVLALLCDARVIDASLAHAPCNDVGLQTLSFTHVEAYAAVADAEVARASQCSTGSLTRHASVRGALEPHARLRATGIGSRLTDGLQAPHSGDGQLQFYPPGYRCNEGVLAFCARLPDNGLWPSLHFDLGAILALVGDTLMKIQELRRQRCPLHPKHVAAIFVYTYNLPTPPGESEAEQIYASMNAAMRRGNADAIAFWRPLIWAVDVAVQVPSDPLCAGPPVLPRATGGGGCPKQANEHGRTG